MISAIGWNSQLEIRRRKLGMSKRAVSKRSGVSLPTVARILTVRECDATVSNVKAIATALGVELRLGVVTRVDELSDAHTFRKEQAVAKANRLVSMVQGTMALEAQAVDSKTIAEMVDQTTCELLAGSPRRLWDG